MSGQIMLDAVWVLGGWTGSRRQVLMCCRHDACFAPLFLYVF
jgi:hypothetical protein